MILQNRTFNINNNDNNVTATENCNYMNEQLFIEHHFGGLKDLINKYIKSGQWKVVPDTLVVTPYGTNLYQCCIIERVVEEKNNNIGQTVL